MYATMPWVGRIFLRPGRLLYVRAISQFELRLSGDGANAQMATLCCRAPAFL